MDMRTSPGRTIDYGEKGKIVVGANEELPMELMELMHNFAIARHSGMQATI